MKKIVLISGCIIQLLWGQSHLDVYKKMGDLYLNASSFRIEVKVNITYIKGYESGNQSYSGLIQKREKQVLTSFADKTNICSQGKNVFIDRNSNLILVSKSDYDEKMIRKNIFSGFEDEAYLKKYSFSFLRSEGTHVVFEILPKESSDVYSRIELTLDNNNFGLQKVVYEMNSVDGNTVSKIEITYPKSEFNIELNEHDFDIKNYIIPKDKSFQGVGSFSGYKIIDQVK